LLYNYFGDRRGLLKAIHLALHTDLAQRVEHAFSTTPGLQNAVRAAVIVHLDAALDNADKYRTALGLNLVPHEPEFAERSIREIAALWGGSERASMLATGALSGVQAMVLRAGQQHWNRDEAIIAITAVAWAALHAVDELGLQMTPWWDPPTQT
jgi:AcrR family transcriptional regulator